MQRQAVGERGGGGVAVFSQFLNRYGLDAEYTASPRTPPAEPASIPLSQQFHPGSTVSYD